MPNQSPTLLSRRKKRKIELRRGNLLVSYYDGLARYLNIGRYPQLGVGYSGVVHYPNNTRYPWLGVDPVVALGWSYVGPAEATHGRRRASVPTHSFASCFDDGMAFLARRCEARMGLALAVHVKGFGFWLRCSIHSSIAASSSATLWKMPRRMRWRVISAKSRSTRLSHELDVGVKCSLKRLCRASQRFTFSVLCVA